MLLEHTLLTSGEVAEADGVYVGWPAHPLDHEAYMRRLSHAQLMSALYTNARYAKLQQRHHALERERKRIERKMQANLREMRAATWGRAEAEADAATGA